MGVVGGEGAGAAETPGGAHGPGVISDTWALGELPVSSVLLEAGPQGAPGTSEGAVSVPVPLCPSPSSSPLPISRVVSGAMPVPHRA